MAKILVLKTMENEKIGEMEIAVKPEEKSIIQYNGHSYRIFRVVEPILERGADIVYRVVVNPV